jgi:hypothetical protein
MDHVAFTFCSDAHVIAIQPLPSNGSTCHNMFKLILTSFPFYTGQWIKILQSLLTVFPFWILASSSCLLDVLQYLVKPSCCGSPQRHLSFSASLLYPLCLHDQMLIIVSLPPLLTHYGPAPSLISCLCCLLLTDISVCPSDYSLSERPRFQRDVRERRH